MADDDIVTVSIESDDGATDELDVPEGLIDVLSEEGETPPEVVGDIAMFGFAQNIHGAVAHSHGDPSEEMKALETQTLDLFEERFGDSFAAVTGHDH